MPFPVLNSVICDNDDSVTDYDTEIETNCDSSADSDCDERCVVNFFLVYFKKCIGLKLNLAVKVQVYKLKIHQLIKNLVRHLMCA